MDRRQSVSAPRPDLNRVPAAAFCGGERVDGHDYLDAALAAGATAVVVDRADVLASRPDVALRVPDAYAALHDLTRAVRRCVPGSPVGRRGFRDCPLRRDAHGRHRRC